MRLPGWGKATPLPIKHTCDELFDEFIRLHVRVTLKPRTVAEYERIIAKHLRPEFREKTVKEVSLNDVQALHSKLKATPRLANFVVSVLAKAMTLAQHWEWRSGLQHPCKGILRYKERMRDRLLTLAEMRAICIDLASGNHHPTVVMAIRQLMVTGCGSDEICRLKWSHIEWNKQQMYWPDTKTGGLTKPISAAVRDLLSDAARYEGSEHVCPPLSGGTSHLTPDVLRPAWGRVLKAACVSHCGIHALRHWFASAAYAEPSVSTTTAMQIVGHKSVQTAARYAQVANAQLVSFADGILERHGFHAKS